MLELVDVVSRYGGITAVRGVSLQVKQGEMIALVGRNGAGKTTLLNTICGFVRGGAGRIIFQGKTISNIAPFKVARLGLLHAPEGRRILAPFTVLENLEIGAQATGDRDGNTGQDLQRVFDLFPILSERGRQVAGSLSGGQQQMLAIGRALMGRPLILLLDEPSLGLSPVVTDQVFAALDRLNREGLTILLVEQNAKRALAATVRTYVIEQGLIVQEGNSAELASNPRMISHYLGDAVT